MTRAFVLPRRFRLSFLKPAASVKNKKARMTRAFRFEEQL
jgi:hypothetical protein